MTENPSNTTPSASVLVADDDPMVRLMARESLRHADFEVSEAANGQEALTRFDRTQARHRHARREDAGNGRLLRMFQFATIRPVSSSPSSW